MTEASEILALDWGVEGVSGSGSAIPRHEKHKISNEKMRISSPHPSIKKRTRRFDSKTKNGALSMKEIILKQIPQ